MKTAEILCFLLLVALTCVVLYFQSTIWLYSSHEKDINKGLLFFFFISWAVYHRLWKHSKQQDKLPLVIYTVFAFLNFVFAMGFFSIQGVILLAIVPITASLFHFIELIFRSIEKFLKKWFY